jgi:hypothetical protein
VAGLDYRGDIRNEIPETGVNKAKKRINFQLKTGYNISKRDRFSTTPEYSPLFRELLPRRSRLKYPRPALLIWPILKGFNRD